VRSVRFSGTQPGQSEEEKDVEPSDVPEEYEEALNLPSTIPYPPSSPPAYTPPTAPKSEEHKSAIKGSLNELIMSKVTLPFQQMIRRSSRLEENSDSDSQEYSDSDGNTINDFNEEELQLLSFVNAYQPEEIRPRPLLKLFIMDYLPAIGDIDAMIKIPRPDEVEDNIGLIQLDEPAIQQSDPTILAMQLRRANRDVTTQDDAPVKRLERADKSSHEIDKWINNIKELHRTRPSQTTVQFRGPMPDIESLMQEFHSNFEHCLDGVKLPTAELDVDLEEYTDICLGLLDIPISKSRIQSLHCFFSLYRETRPSQTTVQFRGPMPDIESLMQEFHSNFEHCLDGVKLPTAELDVDLEEYTDICLGLLDIPISKSRIQSLHCFFSLYREFKSSQHFKNLATEKRDNIDRMEL
ncbi:hypothetical protein OSTOST_01783, partial [Ostertagia ostertagi]